MGYFGRNSNRTQNSPSTSRVVPFRLRVVESWPRPSGHYNLAFRHLSQFHCHHNAKPDGIKGHFRSATVKTSLGMLLTQRQSATFMCGSYTELSQLTQVKGCGRCRFVKGRGGCRDYLGGLEEEAFEEKKGPRTWLGPTIQKKGSSWGDSRSSHQDSADIVVSQPFRTLTGQGGHRVALLAWL